MTGGCYGNSIKIATFPTLPTLNACNFLFLTALQKWRLVHKNEIFLHLGKFPTLARDLQASRLRMEKMKTVPGFGGRYKVSDLGRVFSRGCELVKVRGRYVSLSGRGGVQQVKVCYLVARAFVPNLELRPYVVHVNGDPTDDRAENLRWSEEAERCSRKAAAKEPVWVLRKDGEVVGQWESIVEACRDLGVNVSLARKVARGEARSTGGFVFKWWA